MTPQELVAQALADEWALVAQKYAGYFYGHPVRAGQYGTPEAGKVWVNEHEAWTEPLVRPDDCQFCAQTTDKRVEERILGFQHAIDIEVIRSKASHYHRWVQSPDPRIPIWGQVDSASNRRRFCELFQHEPNAKREAGWRLAPLDMTKLPFYLKKRLCIEWNHLLRDWLEAHSAAFEYDFEAREIKVRVFGDSREPFVAILAADPDENQALLEDLADDYAFAASDPATDPAPEPEEL